MAEETTQVEEQTEVTSQEITQPEQETNLAMMSDEEVEKAMYENSVQVQPQASVPDEAAPSQREDQTGSTEDEVVDEDGTQTEDTLTPEERETYDKIFAPFKANGRDFQVETPEQVIRLMQKGANYDLKMKAIKPHLRETAKLQEAGMLDSDTINMLIDMKNGKPEAVKKFMEMNEIDIEPITETDADGYTPDDHSIPDSHIDFKSTLSQFEDSKHYTEIVETFTDVMDDDTRNLFVSNPQFVEGLHTDMENGSYQKVINKMEDMAILGTATPGNWLNQYIEAAQALSATNTGAMRQEQEVTKDPTTVVADKTVEKRKKSMGRTQTGSNASPEPSTQDQQNFAMLSDEEVEAILLKQQFKG